MRQNQTMAQEPFGDVPLFREIQKILASSEGPLNVEIARQVANAIATQGFVDTDVDPEAAHLLERSVQEAERLVTGYTRLLFDEPVTVDTFGPGQWVQVTLEEWRWLLEHLASHLTGQFMQPQGSDAPDSPIQGAMNQLGPLLMGVQAGTLVGHLAKGALGRYDFPIPRDKEGRLFFVMSNLERVQKEYGIARDELFQWVAVNETSRHLVMSSAPWIPGYLRSLLIEVVDATELDTADLERRLMELQSGGMESLQTDMGTEMQMPIVSTARHQKALARLHAFLAAFEGYASHAAVAVIDETVEGAGRVKEGLRRFRADHKDVEALLGTIVGISLDRGLQTAGERFSAAVVKLKGISALNRVWQAPDNLPTLDEVKDPFGWIERVLDD